ncbi:MAG: APC family permease [Gemmatimonadota bacterium]|jgi:APA family basic amino acid/polyamine antiporter|nr:APC family permease [Gemmatimonadota bacterium]
MSREIPSAPVAQGVHPAEQGGGARLRRDLGLMDAVGVGFGAIVGAGIFVVSGVAAGVAGPAFLIGLIIAAAAAGCNALSSAQLAAEYPNAGGAYEYGYRTLNPWAGFAAGWMFLTSKIAAAGTVALGLAGYVDALFPRFPPRVIAVLAILLFTFLNYRGIRRSARANLLIVVFSVGALLLFAGFGVPSFRMENLRPFAPGGFRGVLEGAALLFFAFTGYARIATLAEEVTEPERIIPRAIGITIVGVIVLYLVVSLVAVGAIGAGGSSGMASSSAPLYLAAEAAGGRRLAALVAAGGIAAMLGVILSQLLGLSRVVFAMARREDLPAFLSHIHPLTRVPDRAILLVGGLAAVTTAIGTPLGITSTAAFAILLYYTIANLAALRMPRAAKRYPDVVPAAGLVGCVVLAFSLSAATILAGITMLAVGILYRVGRVILTKRMSPQ